MGISLDAFNYQFERMNQQAATKILFFSVFFVLWSYSGCQTTKSTGPLKINDNVTPGFKMPEGYIESARLNEKTAGRSAFVSPKQRVLQDLRFPQSKYLYAVDELEFDRASPPHTSSRTKILKPEAYSNWEEAGINDENIKQFLLTPGDYTDWGAIQPKRSGKPSAPVILRYYDPQSNQPYFPEHPVKLKETNKEVIIEGFRFDNINYWTLHGISIRGKSFNKRGVTGGIRNRLHTCTHIVIDYCLFENGGGGGLLMVTSSYNHIQNNVFRQTNQNLNGDGGAVGIAAARDKVSRDNCMVNNEVINFNDGMGLRMDGHQQNKPNDMIGDCPGTVYENNDIYITKELYTTTNEGTFACAENAFDFKNGTKSLLPADRIKIIGNRLWGFRPSDLSCGPSGSIGPAITLHRNASNIIIKDNIIFDVPIVLNILGHDKKFPDESMENIAFVNNLCFDIKKTSPSFYGGAALVIGTGIDAYYNTIVDSRYAIYLRNKKVVNRFQCNTFVNIEMAENFPEQDKLSWSDLNAWYKVPDKKLLYSPNGQRNTIGKTAKEAELDDFVFYIKRWTDPEKKIAPNAIPSATKKGPKVPVASDCHCAEGGDGGRWWAKQ